MSTLHSLCVFYAVVGGDKLMGIGAGWVNMAGEFANGVGLDRIIGCCRIGAQGNFKSRQAAA